MKLYIETLGCPKNFNDSEGIAGIWERSGMNMTDDPAQADAILVNTCGFINDAKKESIDKIFEMADFIEEEDGQAAAEETDAEKKILIVSGCLSQRYGSELFDEMPEVDIFLGVNDYEKLPQIVQNFKRGQRQKLFSCQPEKFMEFSERKTEANPYTATLRIAEGCNNCCAYCVMASEEKICHYIDIPLQHISDHVLSSMNRHSTTESIKDTLCRLRKASPDIHIRTTLITGFPGEREEDFDELVDFVENQKFERLGVFAYSREEGTVAGDMENQIDEEIKQARADSIMRRQMDISREVNEEKVGRIFEVLVDGQDEEGAYIGRTQYDAPEIDNTVIFQAEKELVPGDLVRVVITDAFDYDIVGRMEE